MAITANMTTHDGVELTDSYVRVRIQGGTAQTDVDSDGSYFTGYLIG